MPVVIFTSAYDQYAIRAFEAHALDYLLKPLSTRNSLAHAIREERRWEIAKSQDREITHRIYGIYSPGSSPTCCRRLVRRAPGNPSKGSSRVPEFE